jgi:hypothetical protein
MGATPKWTIKFLSFCRIYTLCIVFVFGFSLSSSLLAGNGSIHSGVRNKVYASRKVGTMPNSYARELRYSS